MKSFLFKIYGNRWFVLFFVSLSATMFRLILQAFVPSSESVSLPQSIIVEAGLLIPSFIVYALIIYFSLAVVFTIIQNGLPGTKLKKGILFGFSFCIMWSIYLLEPLPINLNATLGEIVAYPTVDGLSFVFLGLLLGKFVATDFKYSRDMAITINSMLLMIMAACFLMIRLFFYNIVHINSAFTTHPIETIIWVIVTGVFIGIMYSFMEKGINIKSPIKKSLFFSIIIFGVNIILFNFFIILIYKIDIADLTLRTIADIVSVTIGTLTYEKIHMKAF